jgi:glutaredoxin
MMLNMLRRRTVRRVPADPLLVTVYTRAECCCCHKAIDLLKEYQREHDFTLEQVDVDSDPALASEHGQHVPVVAVDGKVRFRGVVNPILFERLLDARKG